MTRVRRSRYGAPTKNRRLTDAERFLTLVQWWKYRAEGDHYMVAADKVDTHYITLNRWEKEMGITFDKKDNSVKACAYTEIPLDALFACV